MRLFLLSTVSTAALVALAMPAVAGDNMTGVAQAYVGAGSSSGGQFLGDPIFGDPTVYGLNGKGYWTLSPDVHLQADLFWSRADDVVAGGENGWAHQSATEVGGAIHLLHPLDNRARVGFAGSIWNTEFFHFTQKNPDETFGLAAVEGQFFGSDWTVTGQAGFFSAIDCSIGGEACGLTLDSGTFVRGKVRYFLYDNTSASVETVQMWGKVSGGGIFDEKSVDSTQWNLVVEHKFDDSPWAGLISLEQQHDEASLIARTDTSTISLGIKFYLDQPTLKSNDRSGAELDTPTFGNAPSATLPLLLSGAAILP